MEETKDIAVKLVFPPFWAVTQPYLSVPSLDAYLRSKGMESSQIDLNLEAYDYILSSEFLTKCKYEMERYSGNKPREKHKSIDFMDYAARRADEFKNMFRSEESLSLAVYKKCYKFMSLCLSVVSRQYADETISFGGYCTRRYSRDKSSDIQKCIEDVQESKNNDSLLWEVLNRFLPYTVKDTDVIGISVTGDSQIIPSFMLAALIKKSNPAIRIVMGGNVITRLVGKLKEFQEVFQVVDFFLYGEGEYPLYMLVNHLSGRNGIQQVPNLLYQDTEGKIIVNPERYELSIDDLPTPVFQIKDLDRYFSPVKCMPMLTSRGCFWGKCAFCDHSYVYHKKYQRRSLKLLIRDIEGYCREYGCKVINFHDEAIAPAELKELSGALIERNLKIKWTSCARLDMSMSKEILSQAATAGLSVLFFGLESANQRVLQLMNKGTRVDKVEEVLQNSAAAGIWNHAFFICGFPTETTEEFQETLDFIKKNELFIHSTGTSYFTLGAFCPVAQQPEKYQIEIRKDRESDFTFYYDYHNLPPTRSKKEYYERNMQNFILGKFGQESTEICRDHWAMFQDTLFMRAKSEIENTGNRISLCPDVFYETKEQHLYIYTVYRHKMITIRFQARFGNLMDRLNHSLSEEELYSQAVQVFKSTPEKVKAPVQKFLQILKTYECIC